MVAALLSTLHLFALAIGLPALFFRGRALGSTVFDDAAMQRVLAADNVWGLASLLWLGTGLARVFGPFEKGSGYYLHSGPFLVKMGLFVLIFALELPPMIAFIRWRIRLAKKRAVDTTRVPLFFRLNQAEMVSLVAMPFFASAMARGLGFGWFD